MNYNLNHDRLIFDNLPNKLRKRKIFCLIRSIFSALVTVYNNFLAFKDQTNFDIKINCQTIILEKYLQVKFSNVDIQILNSSFIFQQNYLYKKNEIGNSISSSFVRKKNESTSGNSQIYLLKKSEAIINFDFVVKIPLAVINTGITLDQIESVVDQYKKIGTKYDIEII
jgi:hypothetical protein